MSLLLGRVFPMFKLCSVISDFSAFITACFAKNSSVGYLDEV